MASKLNADAAPYYPLANSKLNADAAPYYPLASSNLNADALNDPTMSASEAEASLPAAADAELPTPTPTPTPTPAKVESQRQYRSKRLISKEIRFVKDNTKLYIDLQQNGIGLFFHLKVISPRGKDYILIDLSGLDEFLAFKPTDEKRIMIDKKKTYTFTVALLEGFPILRIRMIEGNHDHSIAIPVEGWSELSKKLRDVLVEHEIGKQGNHS